MPWPIIYRGKILVRNGKLATSLACCCVVCRFPVQYQITLSEASSPYPGIPPDPPIPDVATLIYHGRVRDTLSDPIGGRYWTHLWVVELCVPEGEQTQYVIDYALELQDWKEANSAVGVILNSGEDDRTIGEIKGDWLTTPDNPNEQVDDLFGPIARPGCPPC
jgi:hypothetical protein